MGAAAYVGRVGGLAVALGVGTAVFTGHGVAWADETDSTPSKSPTSATSDTDTTEKTGKTDDADDAEDAPEPEAEPDPDEEDDKDAVEPHENEPDDEDAVDPDTETDPGTETDPDAEVEPEPTTEEPEEPTDDSPSTPSRPSDTTRPPSKTEKTATEKVTTAKTTAKADDPGVPPTKPKAVAVFADASKLAEATPMTVSPRVAALLSTPTPTPKPNLITAVVNVVNSMLDWAKQRAASDPGEAPQPPFLWALMSFARRELENLFVARTPAAMARSAIAAPTSLALTADDAPIAAAAAAVVVPYAAFNPQVSPSTNFVSWVTGKYVYGLTQEQWTLANTLNRYSVHGTDVGVMWDNGMVDDPETPWDEHQVLIAVGDTFGEANMKGRWINNTLFRSSDHDLSDGITIPNGEWRNGNMFGGAPLSDEFEARPIIYRAIGLPTSVTLIPTAGVSLPTEVTKETPFGTIQYVSFMSVSKWGSAGQWNTNYSAIAYSTDNGENFTVAPESVRYNSAFSGHRNFQQSAFVKGDDGYVYVYGTPNGRQGAAYLARVSNDDILNVSKYEYYKKGSSGWFGTTAAKWVKGSPSSASAIIGKSGGACGATKPGNTVSEMSVQYNEYLKKYIVLYGDQFNNIVMRTSDTPEGAWSEANVLMAQQSGGIYAPMLHPWSPSTAGTGSDLYWNLSLWSEYNVMLMKTDLTKI